MIDNDIYDVIDWDKYYIEMLDAVSKRASCNRGKSSAIIVRDKRILSTGYVGAPTGLPACNEVGHKLVKRFEDPSSTNYTTHCIRTIHAELNAILNAARHGISCLDSIMYCTMVPCSNCAMAIIQSGIKKVIAKHPYQKDQETRGMFSQSKIELVVINDNFLY